MAGQRLTDKLSFKVMWAIIGLLAGLCIFFIKDWYIASQARAAEIINLDKRIIILETIVPKIEKFMDKLDKKIDSLEKK